MKSKPCGVKNLIKIGSFDLDITEESGTASSKASPPGILKESRFVDPHLAGKVVHQGFCDKSWQQKRGCTNSMPGSPKSPASAYEVINHTRRLGGCTRCVSFKHDRVNCRSSFRCAVCYKFGHRFKTCFTRAQPSIAWRPKNIVEPDRSGPVTEGSGLEGEEPAAPIISLPNYSSATANLANSDASTAPATDNLNQSNSSSPPASDHPEDVMANFSVDPTPYIPKGLEVEDWARPARGRMVISGNSLRRHEEYAIVSVLPHPPQHLLYDTMDEVVDFFEEVRQVRIASSCLSPLGLCLLRFSSPITRQAMVNLSPFQLDENRDIVVVEHDRGRNWRNCPFTRTCCVMFLAVPLDFQTKEILSLAVGHFGTVVTWTENSRCKSRIFLKCKVARISMVPRSMIICEGNPAGDNGNSWTVPVYVLSSQLNDIDPADEHLIPPNGNPHPEQVQQHDVNHNHMQGIFEDVGDLNQVQQDNANQGWHVPPPPPQVNNMNWEPWQQQVNEGIGENELAAVENLAEIVLENAAGNGQMQHREHPQESHSVSSETRGFFRAPGAPITLEMPLPSSPSACRALTVARHSTMRFDSDYLIREMARRFGLHQVVGPTPSIEMLLQDLAHRAQELLCARPNWNPAPPRC